MQSIHAETLYTGTDVRENAYLSFANGKVVGVSEKPRGEVVGEFLVVTPALVDPHNHIGMHRAGEPAGETESNEQLDTLLPVPDALDSVQMDDPAFRESIESGVLYSCVLPGSGNVIGGRSAVIRHWGVDSSEALIARAGIKAAFGHNVRSQGHWKGARPTTRMGAVALLRAKLHDAREKLQRHQAATPDKKRETSFSAEDLLLQDLLTRRQRLRAHAHKADDIAALLRIAEEFALDVSVEHAGDVHQVEVFRKLAQRNIPVIVGPLDTFASKTELRHRSWRNLTHLLAAGGPFALMTDHPVTLCSNLLVSARWFLRCGASRQDAIETVTRRNAAVLGLSGRLGTLARGRWASFVGWSGDPFDMAAYPAAVYGEGDLLHS